METSDSENKELTITLGMVQRVLRLSKLQIRNIFTAQGRTVPDPAAELQPPDLARLVFADILEKLLFLRPEQRTLVASEMDELISTTPMAEELHTLFFADGRYALWTGRTGFLDLDNGETITEMPSPPQETISYNLNEIYRRFILKMEKRSGLHAQRQNNDGDVEESSDLRDRTDYGLS